MTQTTHPAHFDGREVEISLDNECEMPEDAVARVTIRRARQVTVWETLSCSDTLKAAREAGCEDVFSVNGHVYACKLPSRRRLGPAFGRAWYGDDEVETGR